MDMWPAFGAEVCMHCSKAEVVFDQFHLVANFGKDVIDKVRIHEANRLKEDKAARERITSNSYNVSAR